VAPLAQNSTVPVALTPKVGWAFTLALAPTDIAEIPVTVSSVTIAPAAEIGFQYFSLVANPLVVVENDY
jgi:hypothetical protein